VIVVLDTSVLIDHLRGEPAAFELLSAHAERGDELYSVTVVRTEIEAGLRRGEEAATRRLLDSLKWQDVTSEVADRAGRLARRYLKSHPGVDTVDYIIAAATQLLGARLLTQNVKHFPMFAGLERAYHSP
jgi:predicted nucleic acid-binding protein